jgi:D-hydroxyproline dehydrogenase subunit beta
LDSEFDIAICGAGIAGLAHAYWAAKKGLNVVVVEKSGSAQGASVRNFGLFWPIGQEPEVSLPFSLIAKNVWEEFFTDTNTWHNPSGALGLAYHADEVELIQEFLSHQPGGRYTFLNLDEVLEISPNVNLKGLKGALYSLNEITINSREALPALAKWVAVKYKVKFIFNTICLNINSQTLFTNGKSITAKKFIITSGENLELLFPKIYKNAPLLKCKLQMLKASPDRAFKLGAAVFSATSFIHYPTFSHCKSLEKIKSRFQNEKPLYSKYGINLLMSQNNYGELLLGDSHEYGDDISLFNKEEIDTLILNGIGQMISLEKVNIVERWSGTYVKSTTGKNFFRHKPTENILIVNGLGGAGMTISFGLAKENVEGFTA